MAGNDPVDVFKHIEMSGPDDCWCWQGAWGGRARDRRPYFMANRRRTLAYRWVWELVNGPIPDGQLILHSCDNGGWPIGCCQPKHMRLGSVQDNSNDMMQRERHGLPATAVAAIRRLLDRGDTQQVIAERYGVSRETISAIATGRVYKGSARPQAANVSPGSNEAQTIPPTQQTTTNETHMEEDNGNDS